jgi:hypothetical protein
MLQSVFFLARIVLYLGYEENLGALMHTYSLYHHMVRRSVIFVPVMQIPLE